MTSQRIRVRNVYPFTDADKEMLDSVDARYRIVHEGADTQDWADALDDADVEVLWASSVPSDLSRVPRLRWLATAGAGVDDLVPRDPWASGLVVTNGSGVHAVPMAEYVLGAAFMAMEHIPDRLANQERRAWTTARWDLASRGLRGRTALIVGYGSIGREVARLLDACGVGVLAVKREPLLRADTGWVEPGTGDPDCNVPRIVAGPDALVDLAPQADLLVLTMPGTASTIGLVDAAVLDALRPGAWVINVGRGSAIDEDALLDALRSGRIGGAVLDVTSHEPLPEDHPLWSEPRCVVTPHVSGLGDIDAIWHRVALLFAENLRRDAADAPLLNQTSGVRGY